MNGARFNPGIARRARAMLAVLALLVLLTACQGFLEEPVFPIADPGSRSPATGFTAALIAASAATTDVSSYVFDRR